MIDANMRDTDTTAAIETAKRTITYLGLILTDVRVQLEVYQHNLGQVVDDLRIQSDTTNVLLIFSVIGLLFGTI